MLTKKQIREKALKQYHTFKEQFFQTKKRLKRLTKFQTRYLSMTDEWREGQALIAKMTNYQRHQLQRVKGDITIEVIRTFSNLEHHKHRS